MDLHAKAWVLAFQDSGHKVRFEEVRKQIGKGGDQLMPVFLSKEEIERIGKALGACRGAILKERYLTQTTAFPAVRELFQPLIADGKQIALASSAKEDELAQYKKIANIGDQIAAETSSEDAEQSKPHFPAALPRLANKSPDRTIVVGDKPYDAEAAAKAGLRTTGLLCGGWSEDELRRSGCMAVFKDPADLLARYDQSPLGAEDRG